MAEPMMDREFVERHLEWVNCCICGATLSERRLCRSCWHERCDKCDAAAADFTRERLREIHVAKAAIREILSLRDRWGEIPQWTWLNGLASAALADLQRGMRGQS